MALFPYFVRNLDRDYWDSNDWPQSIFNQHFGLDLQDFDELLWPSYQRTRPTRQQMLQRSGASELVSDPNKFAVKVDVSHFSPEDITVKAVNNNLEIHGKHEEKLDKHGWVKREFTRRYALPTDVEADKLASNLNAGILTIEAPKKEIEYKEGDERVIPINVESRASIEAKQPANGPKTNGKSGNKCAI